MATLGDAHDASPDSQPAVLMPEFMVLRQPAAGWVELIALTIGGHPTRSDPQPSTRSWSWRCTCGERGTTPNGLAADDAMRTHVAEKIAQACGLTEAVVAG